MKLRGKNILFIIASLFLITMLTELFDDNGIDKSANKVPFTSFLDDVEDGRVVSIKVQNNIIEATDVNNNKYITYAINYPNIVDKLRSQNIIIDVIPNESMHPIWGIILSWFPLLLLIGIYIFFMKQMQGGGGKMMGFGKSKAVLLQQNKKIVKFKDVAGVEDAKQDLKEIIDFLKSPEKYNDIGARIPKGVLLSGPPGTGKTLLARAVAGESNVPFFSISGSDFVEMFVGVGASRVRDMFEQGKANAPCILFIDEIDAVGRHRGSGVGGGNDEREQTLNQLLVEMDGFSKNEGVIIIAATNRVDVLDPALLRPGRFDRQVAVSNPDLSGREEIIKIHLQKIKFCPDVDPRTIARGTPGFSGADLENIVNEAALLAARLNNKLVTMKNIEDAKDKIMMGSERKTLSITEEEMKLTAYHEAGHALVALKMEHSDPIHKATIVPRGHALGMVVRLPEKDQVSLTRIKAHSDLAVMMAGRAAEEIIFGYNKITSGASSDIEAATKLANNMVRRWGMSDTVGLIHHSDDQTDNFGRIQSHISESRVQEIDRVIKEYIDNAYNKATEILETYNKEFHGIAQALLKYETLTGEELIKISEGKEIKKILSEDNQSEENNNSGNHSIDL